LPDFPVASRQKKSPTKKMARFARGQKKGFRYAPQCTPFFDVFKPIQRGNEMTRRNEVIRGMS
jgi:hypothetical protein